MDLIFITNDPAHARLAEDAGARRVMVDLERRGKRERQGHLDTRVSDHAIDDVAGLRRVVTSAELMVRVNPLDESSPSEIARCIGAGADVVMLPMFTSTDEVRTFVELLGGAARPSLLVETPQAVARLAEVVAVEGVAEVHVGLNDLHLALGLDFMFELLAGGLVDHCSRVALGAGLRFGFGGIAPLGDGLLPSELVVLEHVRLGSTQAFMTRAFDGLLGSPKAVSDGIRRLLERFAEAARLDVCELEGAHEQVRERVAALAAQRRQR